MSSSSNVTSAVLVSTLSVKICRPARGKFASTILKSVYKRKKKIYLERIEKIEREKRGESSYIWRGRWSRRRGGRGPFSPRGRRERSQSDIRRVPPARCFQGRSPWSSTSCPLPGIGRRPATCRKRRYKRRKCLGRFVPGTVLRKFGRTRTLRTR